MNTIEVTILSIIIMITIGYILKRIDFFSSEDTNLLNKIVINLLLPCMIFNGLYSADLSLISKLGILPFIMLFTSFFTGLISFIILKYFNYDDKKLWSVLVTIMIANTAFMGYPVTLGIFGYDGFIRAIFCDISTSCIFLILSFILVLKFGGSVKGAFKKILTFPPLWAIILALIFNSFSIPIPETLNITVGYFADATVPLIMLSLGISINLEGLYRNKIMVIFTSIMKLAIFPLIAFIIVNILGLVDLQYTISVVEASMPSGMLSLVLAITYKLDSELTSDCILINTVISLITLPIIVMIL